MDLALNNPWMLICLQTKKRNLIDLNINLIICSSLNIVNLHYSMYFNPVVCTDCKSAEGYPTSCVLGMTLSHLSGVLELCRMWSTSSLQLLPGPLWPRVVVPVRVTSIGQIELFNHSQYLKPFNCVQTND